MPLQKNKENHPLGVLVQLLDTSMKYQYALRFIFFKLVPASRECCPPLRLCSAVAIKSLFTPKNHCSQLVFSHKFLQISLSERGLRYHLRDTFSFYKHHWIWTLRTTMIIPQYISPNSNPLSIEKVVLKLLSAHRSIIHCHLIPY